MELKRLDLEDLEIILGTLKEFAEREMPFEKRREWDRTDVCPADVVRSMLSEEVGLHLVFIPAEYDGMGGGAYDVYRLSCEFAKIDLGVATARMRPIPDGFRFMVRRVSKSRAALSLEKRKRYHLVETWNRCPGRVLGQIVKPRPCAMTGCHARARRLTPHPPSP